MPDERDDPLFKAVERAAYRPMTDAMPQMVASAAMAYRSVTGGAVNYDAMQAALEAALPLAMKAEEEASDQFPADEVERIIEHAKKYDTQQGDPRRRFTLCQMETAIRSAIRNGDEGMLPDIYSEGERLANETPKTNGAYLWTDLVGAIQTAIAEERARHVRLA